MTEEGKPEDFGNTLTMSRALFDDYRRYARRDMKNDILAMLKDQLDIEATGPSFYEDGLVLAISLIEGIDEQQD